VFPSAIKTLAAGSSTLSTWCKVSALRKGFMFLGGGGQNKKRFKTGGRAVEGSEQKPFVF